MDERLRYPIGRFDAAGPVADTDRPALIDALAALPAELRAAVEDLDAAQLDTPYREGGWTVRQLVHHVPDSHLNAYIRFKWALTEDEPPVRTYDENAWSGLIDAAQGPIDMSLHLLDALHVRWVALLRGLTAAQWSRQLRHPEMGRFGLTTLLAHYAWHGRHHTAHVTALRARMGW